MNINPGNSICFVFFLNLYIISLFIHPSTKLIKFEAADVFFSAV